MNEYLQTKYVFTINETLSKVKGVGRFTKYFSIGYSLTPRVFVD